MTTAPSVLLMTEKQDIIQDEYQQNDAAMAQLLSLVLVIAGSTTMERTSAATTPAVVTVLFSPSLT